MDRVVTVTDGRSKKRRGVLHGYGTDMIRNSNGVPVGQQTVAIVEFEDKTVSLVSLTHVTFETFNSALNPTPAMIAAREAARPPYR